MEWFVVYNKWWEESESCLMFCKIFELWIKFVMKNLNYMSTFLSVNSLFRSESWDARQIIRVSLEFPQPKLILECFYIVIRLVFKLILSLQLIYKSDCKPTADAEESHFAHPWPASSLMCFTKLEVLAARKICRFVFCSLMHCFSNIFILSVTVTDNIF